MDKHRTFLSHQPSFVSVDTEIVRKSLDVCQIAIENTQYCIEQFKQQNTWKLKETFVLRELEKELATTKATRNELRTVLNWPLLEDETHG